MPELDPRLARALDLLNEGKVLLIHDRPKEFLVQGTSNYLVSLEDNTCSCPDHVNRGVNCKHILASSLMRNRKINGTHI